MEKSNLAQNWRIGNSSVNRHKIAILRKKYRSRNDLKFHNYGTVIFLLLLCIPIIFIGYKSKLVEKADAQITVYAQAYQQEASKSATLEDQNQALEKKLMGEVVPLAPQNIQDLSKFYIKKYFTEPGAYDKAVKVFTCESGLSNTRIHVNKAGLGTDNGIAQVNDVFHQKQFEQMFHVPFKTGIFDFDMNIKFAHWLYVTHGDSFSPWVCAQVLEVK